MQIVLSPLSPEKHGIREITDNTQYVAVARVHLDETLENKSHFNALSLELSKIDPVGVRVFQGENAQWLAVTQSWWNRYETSARQLAARYARHGSNLPDAPMDAIRVVQMRLNAQLAEVVKKLRKKYKKQESLVNEFVSSDEWQETLRRFAADYIAELKKRNIPLEKANINVPKWFVREFVLRVENYILRKL